MSRMSSKSSGRRPRPHITDEDKASVVRLVLDEGKTVGATARELDLTETAVRSSAEGARARVVRGESRTLRQSPHPSGSDRSAGTGEPQARRSADAGRLVARARKRFKVTTMSDHDQPVADNLIQRDFAAILDLA